MAALVLTMFIASLAQAQATRTWVSGVGDDANPCSRTAPCKTFAGAISKTATAGEISVLDPGGYGTLNITKSITVDGGTGAGWGSVLAAGTTGFIINAAGATDVVTLRNLSINGASTGTKGIRIIDASKVFIDHCNIFGFKTGSPNGRGISDERITGTDRLHITDTIVENNGQSGIVLLPASGTTGVQASLNNVTVRGNGLAGLVASTGTKVTVANSTFTGHTSSAGLLAEGGAVINAESCVTSENSIGVQSTASTVTLSNVTVTNNATGLSGSSIFSYGNNKIAGNTAGNGPPTPGGPSPQ
ncbi:MAG TPA: right-handed parallel beta-helix repeat-containing protein [Pyrinomonadaceae bacterium]